MNKPIKKTFSHHWCSFASFKLDRYYFVSSLVISLLLITQYINKKKHNYTLNQHNLSESGTITSGYYSISQPIFNIFCNNPLPFRRYRPRCTNTIFLGNSDLVLYIPSTQVIRSPPFHFRFFMLRWRCKFMYGIPFEPYLRMFGSNIYIAMFFWSYGYLLSSFSIGFWWPFCRIFPFSFNNY